MKIKHILIFCAIVSASPEVLFGEVTRKNTACDSALHLLVTQNYTGAQKLLSEHLQKFPGDNEALYLTFAIEQTRILDYESYQVENKRFQAMADSIRVIFEKRLKVARGTDSVECLFYIANVYGGIGVVQAKNGNWFDAVKHAVSSVSILKQVKNIDPDFYAAYLGIGVFNYYLSNSFKWLPFVKKEKELEGIKAVEKALYAEFPYNYAAKNSLCWILIERKEFKRADSLAQSVLNDIPENTIFLRIKALIALWTGKYPKAIEHATRLIALSEKRDPVNWSDLVAGYTVLVDSHGKLKAEKKAYDAAEKITGMEIPEVYLEIPHVKKNMKFINDMKQKYRTFASK